MDIKISEQHLLQIKEICDNLDIPLGIIGGTLLGIIRENRLLPWDHDLDFWLPSSLPIKQISQLNDQLQQNDFLPWETFITPKEQLIAWSFTKDNIRAGFTLLFPSRDFKHIIQLGMAFGRRTGPTATFIPARFFKDLSEIKFLGKTFLAPNPPEEFLGEVYGNTPERSWRTPKEYESCTRPLPWNTCVVRLYKGLPWIDVIRRDEPARIRHLKKKKEGDK